MTYDEFLDIPASVLKDLETILRLKLQYQMDLTSEERGICEHMKRMCDERVKSVELVQQQLQLEKLLKL